MQFSGCHLYYRWILMIIVLSSSLSILSLLLSSSSSSLSILSLLLLSSSSSSYHHHYHFYRHHYHHHRYHHHHHLKAMISTQIQALFLEAFEDSDLFRLSLRLDILAVMVRDPAVKSYTDVILYFKGR